MSCRSRVDRALEGAVRLPLGDSSRYVLFSDCHRGEGTNNDNFLKNQHLWLAAAEYYLRRGFFYIDERVIIGLRLEEPSKFKGLSLI